MIKLNLSFTSPRGESCVKSYNNNFRCNFNHITYY